MPLTKTTGQPLDPEQQAQRYKDIPNSGRIVDANKIEGTPQFRALGDLKAMFKSNILVQLPMPNGEIADFRVKRVDPGTLFMTNRTLIFLLKQGYDQDSISDVSTLEVLKTFDEQKMREFEEAMTADLRVKQDLILANVIEPPIDREFLELLPPEGIDLLFTAIAQGLEESQPLLETFPESESDTRREKPSESNLFNVDEVQQKAK